MTEILFGLYAADQVYCDNQNSDYFLDDTVLCLILDLDVGNISSLDSELNGFDFTGDMIRNLPAIEELKKAKKDGHHVRIWFCPANPSEMMSLMYLCYVLKDSECPVSCVQISNTFDLNGIVLKINSTDEAPVEMLRAKRAQSVVMSMNMRNYFASEFERVKNENSQLRTLINERMVSVPENFFDGFIMDSVTDEFTPITQIIGSVTRKVSGLNERFIYNRILQLKDEDILSIHSLNSGKYSEFVMRKGETDNA
ncbi:MAG: DUF1835 domain-containing protein [Anaerofustis stercorihominis]|nr:DUF1835 domain-containing protein [Anaerofustis stercorihominis]